MESGMSGKWIVWKVVGSSKQVTPDMQRSYKVTMYQLKKTLHIVR